ncbi:glycosyltransferase [Bradyrhizobium manausense]|uniref:glycosyltransferase family 2 protein n=1 Tax=Bradyrhizobium TaxID=374 RepID=UPI001BAC391E|nr:MULTISPECIES: glycosyltransferase [Bradyrhizobium]MBR0825103.1 glycosyltransferase [Bradyrhizobium manausense]UVO32451.1 glycosyltransferase [Bradyrhizobium arachidis]
MNDRTPGADPRLSVVMTAFGDLRFIVSAVRSILDQTYKDFELIVVDDGSGEDETFARLGALDARIRVITSRQNIGTYAAANLGIANARGEIIARIDADDLAEPTRLARLVQELDRDQDLGLIGTWARHISETGEGHHFWTTPVTDTEVRWTILFANPFCHSSAAFRRTAFDSVGGYNATMRQSGDYELWWKLIDVCRAANIPEPLVQYRQNSRGLTAGNPSNWRERTDPFRRQSWERLGVGYEPQLVPHMAEFMLGQQIADWRARPRTYRVMLQLLTRFLAQPRRGTDQAVARKLASTIVGRILDDRSLAPVDRIRLWPLCAKLDWTATIAAVTRLKRR